MSEPPMFDIPPTKLKIFAPNGETQEVIGWFGIRDTGHRRLEVFLCERYGKPKALNVFVVVQEQKTGVVLYSPRDENNTLHELPVITDKDRKWLADNPSWPAILELEDNPVEN